MNPRGFPKKKLYKANILLEKFNVYKTFPDVVRSVIRVYVAEFILPTILLERFSRLRFVFSDRRFESSEPPRHSRPNNTGVNWHM